MIRFCSEVCTQLYPLLLCTGVVVTAGLFAAITAIHIVSLKCLGVHMILALLTRGRRQLFKNFFKIKYVCVRASVCAVTLLWFRAMCVIHTVTGISRPGGFSSRGPWENAMLETPLVSTLLHTQSKKIDWIDTFWRNLCDTKWHNRVCFSQWHKIHTPLDVSLCS